MPPESSPLADLERERQEMLRLLGVHRPMHVRLGLLCGGLLALLVWAAVFQLDVVSVAEGVVAPSSRLKRVDHLEGGIVREILVREGDVVTAGQPLVVLEQTAQGATLEEVTVRKDALALEAARLQAEAEAGPLVLPESEAARRPDLAEQTRQLHAARRERLDGQKLEADQAIQKQTQEIESLKARIRNARNELALTQKELALSAGLLKDKLTTEFNHIKLEKQAAALKGRIEEDQALVARGEAALAEIRQKREGLTSQFQEEARQALQSVRRELAELAQRQERAADVVDRAVIRAPADGVVKDMAVTTVGQVAQPGATLLHLVPSADSLVVEARLPVRDVGYVRAGQRATLRLASGDAARFGHLEGVVTHVSPDAFSTDKGLAWFLVRVETNATAFVNGPDVYTLHPGVGVTASIHTGTRSVLAYVLSPLRGSLSFALRER